MMALPEVDLTEMRQLADRLEQWGLSINTTPLLVSTSIVTEASEVLRAAASVLEAQGAAVATEPPIASNDEIREAMAGISDVWDSDKSEGATLLDFIKGYAILDQALDDCAITLVTKPEGGDEYVSLHPGNREMLVELAGFFIHRTRFRNSGRGPSPARPEPTLVTDEMVSEGMRAFFEAASISEPGMYTHAPARTLERTRPRVRAAITAALKAAASGAASPAESASYRTLAMEEVGAKLQALGVARADEGAYLSLAVDLAMASCRPPVDAVRALCRALAMAADLVAEMGRAVQDAP